jgi:hypothetical protein
MIVYDHKDPAARFLYEKAGRAAYAAYRRLEWEPDQHFEDAKQGGGPDVLGDVCRQG